MIGLHSAGIVPSDDMLDRIVSLTAGSCFVCYLTFAVRKMYGNGWIVSTLKAFALCFASFYIVNLNRFLLFLVTFGST